MSSQASEQAPRTGLRCRCHKLLLMVAGNTLEIKCSRCQRIVVIETSGIRSISYVESPGLEPARSGTR